jgi:hypothetical protein
VIEMIYVRAFNKRLFKRTEVLLHETEGQRDYEQNFLTYNTGTNRLLTVIFACNNRSPGRVP